MMDVPIIHTHDVSLSPSEAALVMLHGHLDAVLRHGEEMLARTVDCSGSIDRGTGVSALLRQARNVERFVLDLLTSEQCIALRCIRARQCAETAAREDRALKSLAVDVETTTAPLLEAAQAAGSSDHTDTQLVLSSRGLGSPHIDDHLAPTEAYRLMGRLPLGDVLDAVADLLDTVERMAPASVQAAVQIADRAAA